MSKIMIALGGNALGSTPAEQRQLAAHASKAIADLIAQGHQVVVSHGNGPQAGMIESAFRLASTADSSIPAVPLNDCVAMSQAYIGYHLQNALREELLRRGIRKEVVSVVTQAVVDEKDPAFLQPSKPIGSFYSREEAQLKAESEQMRFVEDSGRGYRQVVASPQPVRIVEAEAVRKLIASGQIVITAGGGGIPVFEQSGALIPAQAVIDKDAASARLAAELDLDDLFILTAVDKVAIHYGTPQQRDLDKVTPEEARAWIAEGQFPSGSMLPKVESALRFVESKPGRRAVITSLEKAGAAIRGETGTFFCSGAAASARSSAPFFGA
ncbi:carbamate kinase [Paenibacillus tepidiphilus]|uniref:carbamate kinase n=1 Tax=Paenibacillus tepidiphilus TaxID=2608683 RepID=UPI001239D88C|nr:carbamate kinase [Paenibacillus tepidiphilus]